MDYLLEKRRKIGFILGAVLIIIPFLTMPFMEDSKGEATFCFIHILFPQNIVEESFYLFIYVIIPIIILVVISAILNLLTERFRILSAIVGVLALGLHIFFYYWVGGSFSAAVLGVGWYIMGIGFIFLIVSPFVKKSRVKSLNTND